ncbi:hypothetical protein JYT16_00520 [Gemmatimonas aurantiaca]|nr:hypothetical protein [Gemmatimonas aurantiaca]
MSKFEFYVSSCLLLLICAVEPSYAQFNPPPDTTRPFYASFPHGNPDTLFVVSNFAYADGGLAQLGALWVGGIIGRDTIVSAATDGWTSFGGFSPESYSFHLENGTLPVQRSIADTSAEGRFARSMDDVIFYYFDGTGRLDSNGLNQEVDGALNIQVKQSSYYWPGSFAKNILLVNYEVTNIGSKTIRDVYLGSFIDGWDQPREERPPKGTFGYIDTAPGYTRGATTCSYTGRYLMAWYALSDGNPNPETRQFDDQSRTGVYGIMILDPSVKLSRASWNWWLSNSDKTKDFGPRKVGTAEQPFRNWKGRLGTPLGDENLYHMMSNGEMDYDQYTTALDHTGKGYLPPPRDALEIVTGRYDTHAVYSVGPFDIPRGQAVSFTVALIIGENFHTVPAPLPEKLDPHVPEQYYNDYLDFSDLLKNATWAQWIFDNPGYDTDGDGYAGEFILCDVPESLLIDTTYNPDSSEISIDTFVIPARIDSLWYQGDGIPDFRGAAPPEEPAVRYTSTTGVISLRWNGLRSETVRDFFTLEYDFEGYRVYLGLVPRHRDLVLISSYDLENYAQFYFEAENSFEGDDGKWKVLRKPWRLEEVQNAYAPGNPLWHPLDNGIANPLLINDSLFYFANHDWNQSNFRDTVAIHKVYPDAPYPHTLILDSAFTEDTWWPNPQTGDTVFYQGGELTNDGKFFKHFEYRYILENMLASQQYYLAVTAFDFGSPEAQLPALETHKLNTVVEALAQDPVSQDLPDGLDVIVYPNPYRADARYREDGFEGRGREGFIADRVRAVHFSNLPPRCTIWIYSLDGDLIRQIEHQRANDDPAAMHEVWDVITRNLQAPVSGIYYWIVQTPEGLQQIGKLVLIM